jgi:MFS family permease
MKSMNKKLFWIYLLSGAVYFTQGIEGLPGLSLFFYLKESLHFNVSTIMYIGSITTLAWLIKPVLGFFIDNYLTKKTFIILSLIGSIFISLFFGLTPILPLFLLVAMLMLANFNSAIRDISVDGIMCVEGKETNNCDRIQTIQWICITIAGIITGLLGGYIADHYSYKLGYLFLIPVYLIIIGIVLKYKTNVPKNKTEESCTTCFHKTYCGYCASLWCEDYKKERLNLLQSICSYKELFTNKQFLLGAAFLFVYNFAPGFGTPLMFIQRDVFKWSGSFMGLLAAISSILSIIGAVIYFKYSKKLNIKKCLFWSVFIVGLTNICYLYFTPVSAIVYTFLFSFLSMFIFLNLMTFMAKSTLNGKEATSFALLCSINNLSATLSTLTGAWLFPLIGLKTIIIIAACSAFLSLPILKRLEIKGTKTEARDNE